MYCLLTERAVVENAGVGDVVLLDDATDYLRNDVPWRTDLYQVLLLFAVQVAPLPRGLNVTDMK